MPLSFTFEYGTSISELDFSWLSQSTLLLEFSLLAALCKEQMFYGNVTLPFIN